ncbi:MAG TPA: DUF2510 domain-containing protein [Mycobacteriales bacterium]|nr:DUF2510 domain-containing protein [Mycobacteriales bacterium]
MTQGQPPAGWYPDPQDATQQRYWDGSAWTGHTAAAGAAAVGAPTGDPAAAAAGPPTGDPAASASVPTDAAPSWTMPADGGMGVPVSTKKSWYKRKALIIPLVIVVALFVIGIVVALVNGVDHSNELENAIKDDGQTQLQHSLDSDVPGAKVTINDVSCVETGSTQKYTCQIHLTLTSPDGSQTLKLLQHATGTCDKNVTTHCLWSTVGDPVKDNS